MAKLNINNIENVEGKYHLMFLEGKNAVETAKNDLRFANFSMLLFATFVLLFVIVSGFNIYYLAFLLIFLIVFAVTLGCLFRVKRKATKKCVYAVQNSKTTDIVAKQVDNRGAGKALVKSMSSTVDRYAAKEKYPSVLQKFKRKRKHMHLVGIINEFEKEDKKSK
ncbi:MAG: hypothetical protein IJX00_03010 [Clostridia bacterium]|nr:hypothetical protein [Clostridia bacterium]